MSRNGVARMRLPLTIRMTPACSTTKIRPLPSPAPVANSGAEKPLATGSSWRRIWSSRGEVAPVPSGLADRVVDGRTGTEVEGIALAAGADEPAARLGGVGLG